MSWLWEANKRERRCGGTGWGEGGGAFRTSGCTPICETFLLTWSALFLLLSLKLKLKSVDYSKSLKIQNNTANVPSILKYVENTLVDKGKHLSKKFLSDKVNYFLTNNFSSSDSPCSLGILQSTRYCLKERFMNNIH